MPELQIVELPTSELVEYSRNSKLHPHEQVDQIASSIQEFGNNDPIAVWHNENGEPEIVEGHGRLMALRKLEIETAPVIYLDHLTDEQRRAYALVHNKLTMNSDFDFEMLQSELDNIADIDMTQYDFNITVEGSEIEYRSDDMSDKFTDTLGVFITCGDEEEQQRVYEEILEGGYECRLLTL